MKTLRFEMFFKVNVQLSLNKIIFFHEIGGVRTCQFSSSRFQDGRGVVKLYKMPKQPPSDFQLFTIIRLRWFLVLVAFWLPAFIALRKNSGCSTISGCNFSNGCVGSSNPCETHRAVRKLEIR